MPDPDFIAYLKTLKPEEWQVMVTPKWTVKDVVAHMVGWEKGDVEAIRSIWKTKQPAWWKGQDNFDDFNNQAVEFYKNYTPERLIAEWEMWQKKVGEEIDKIGYENIKSRPDLFDWLFEGIQDNRQDGNESHYKHHYNQIKKALGNNR